MDGDRAMRPGGPVGTSLWDFGQADINDLEFSRHDPDIYAKLLTDHIDRFRHFSSVLELQQEAHYGSASNRAWSSLDLWSHPAFLRCLIDNDFLAIHTKTQDVDISEFENHHHRDWSLRQFEGAIDLAVRLNADALTFHPGIYNEKAGDFWPKPEEALGITNLRRVTFEDSLRKILAHFVEGVRKLEQRLGRFEAAHPGLVQDLMQMFAGLRQQPGPSAEADAIRYEITRTIHDFRVPLDIIRHSRRPDQGLHLVLKNVDPPNFLLNTPRQHVKWFRRMMEIYSDLVSGDSFFSGIFERYRPYMLVDPGHYLNSQVIFKLPENARLGHLFEDFDEFLGTPFVTLPGEYPRDGAGRVREPILNRFVRENGDDILYAHIAGSRKMDRHMTTHDPIKAFRTQRFMAPDPAGRPILKYATNEFEVDKELNLEEVVQVIGFHRYWVPVIFDRPYEVILSSCIHLEAYLAYLEAQHRRMLEVVRRRLEGEDPAASGPGGAGTPATVPASALAKAAVPTLVPGRRSDIRTILERIERASFFIRPFRQYGTLWKPGYEEAVFYDYQEPGGTLPVSFLASVRDADHKVLVRGLALSGERA